MINLQHPNYKDSQSVGGLPTTGNNFVETNGNPNVLHSKDVLEIFLILAQSKCQLNIQVICSNKQSKQCSNNTITLQVYSTVSIQSIKDRILEQASYYGIKVEDKIYLFQKKFRLQEQSFLFEALVEVMKIRSNSLQDRRSEILLGMNNNNQGS